MNDNLNNPYNRYLFTDSPAWDAFPNEQKVCVMTEPLCNPYIKARNYGMARPYNFMMNVDQWGRVKNRIELLMAIRFGMEWDTKQYPDSQLADLGFHTQMYIRFHQYVLKHSIKEAAKIVAEFEQTAFKVRFLSAFAIGDLLELRNLDPFSQGKSALTNLNSLKKTIKKLNVTDAVSELSSLQRNGGPLHINREMFKQVFKQDYNPKMIDILKSQGVYKGDPINVERAAFEKNH
ncbi:hypothetical protein [Acinetobacter colistiniresistens]|uniref:Uncharacterized protein n=1 Tax=Acinetobacter colistiniresistens TaxID=280145 RepID=S3T9H1_9GAMM|nr:hypothetical protein [Acinetobacter colistiniresistens]EPG37573.1 hypothetical protein F907_01543 [Acinetobacter colistiniresistens]TVT87040.1 hypothetical protein FPV60_02220 [Acinetobacter colistiniresistens]